MKTTMLSSAVAIALLAMSSSAFAITNDENNATLPFSFSNPGARSLGMGGAFLGAADDATAAYTNPAGLTRLGFDQQVSLELRQTGFDTRYPSGGSFTTAPFDTSGVRFDRASEEVDEVSFVSWVLPRDNWAVALYRHQFLNYENMLSTDPISFGLPNGDQFATFGYDAATDIEIVNWGASFAYSINDQLSVGLGISYYDFELDSLTTRYAFDDTPANTDEVINAQAQSGSDNDIGYNIGLLYRGTDRFSIGLSYRSAPRFDYRAASAVNTDDGPVVTANRVTRFKAPDMFGVGFSWRATDQLTINLDVNRVNYNNLSEGLDSAFSDDDQLTPVDQLVLNRITSDNVWEPRLGGEYVLDQMKYPVSLRAGVWREEAHKLTFVGDPDNASFEGDFSPYASAVLFSPGEDETHVAVGFGIAFPRFQLDFAYDGSDSRDTVSLSGVMRF